ncbi:MAG: TonB-dependent receptor [Spongiibacteraceae bacterium]
MKLPSQMMQKALAVAVLAVTTTTQAAQLEEIIVTATKRMETIQDVPISVAVMTADDISAAKIDTSVDLALMSPSLNFQQGFGPASSSFGMRGLNTFALEGGIQPSVSFVLDGVGLARVGEFQAELGDIERVEILRGPQGTLFGRNATAGAINMVRVNPHDEFEAYIEGSITDDKEYITRVMVNDSLSDTVSGRVSAYSKSYDGFINNKYPGADDEGSDDSWGVLGKLSVDMGDNANVVISAEYRKSDANMSPSVTTIVENTSTTSFMGPIRLAALGNGNLAAGQAIVDDLYTINQNVTTTADTENWGLSSDITWDINDNQTLKSITAYRAYTIDNNIDVDATPAGPSDLMNMPVVGIQRSNLAPNGPDETPIKYDTYYFSQEFRLEGSTDEVDYIFGAYYNQYHDKSANEVGLIFADYIFETGPAAGLSDGIIGNDYYFQVNPLEAEAVWEGWAMFGDATWQVTENVSIFAGLRWTSEDVELDYNRIDIRGPYTGAYITPNGNDVIIDTDALLNSGYAAFSSETNFKRKDRSEDWSGRLGISWDINYDVNMYASVSRGFIGSGVNFGRTATEANAIVDPSINEAMEIGLKATWFDGTVRTNAAIFNQEVTDLQTSRLIPGTVNTETFNAGTLKSRGAEADITWGATEWLTLDLSATYLDTEYSDLIQPCYPDQSSSQGCTIDNDGNGTFDAQDLDGRQAVVAPELSYRFSARLDLPFNDMPFTGYALLAYTWQDEVQYKLTYDPLTEQDAYGLTDITIGIEDKDGRYQVSIFGKNITDEEFVANLDASPGSIGRQYARVPRQSQAYFGIKARYTFF